MVRIITHVLALALAYASVQAGQSHLTSLHSKLTISAPTPEPSHASPALFSHDPYSIHRRSLPALKRDEPEPEPESESQVDLTEEGTCSSECGVRQVSGVKNEREALCSQVGLEATRMSPTSSFELSKLMNERCLCGMYRYCFPSYSIPEVCHVGI
jgi:hypothetical protein